MHEDKEIRYLLEGSGYFDVRGKLPSRCLSHQWPTAAIEHSTESWIRCHMSAGDLLVLPAGIYHRFSLDEKNRVRIMRLFKVGLPPMPAVF